MKKHIFKTSALGLILLSLSGCTKKPAPEKAQPHAQTKTQTQPAPTKERTLKLVLISNYGESEKTLSEKPTEVLVQSTLTTLDWNQFHQVLLMQDANNFMEVGGSLDPTDGFSGLVKVNGIEKVTRVAPKSVKEMTDLMLSYFRQNDQWKTLADWD